MEWLLIFLLIILPMPFSLYGVWRDYLISRKIGESVLLSLAVSVPILSLIAMAVVISDKGKESDTDFVGYKFRGNGLSTCRNCNITSRYYQLHSENKDRCPLCGNGDMSTIRYEDDSTYPFAPKLSEFGAIKYLLNKNKLTKIKEKLHNTELYDKELEAYEKLQMKKLKELEAKANEIRVELAKSGVN